MHRKYIEDAERAARHTTPVRTDVPEAATIARSLIKSHQPKVVALATLLHLSRSLLAEFGQNKGHDLAPLVALQRECVGAWAAENDIGDETLLGALDGFSRASKTVRYLAAVPV